MKYPQRGVALSQAILDDSQKARQRGGDDEKGDDFSCMPEIPDVGASKEINQHQRLAGIYPQAHPRREAEKRAEGGCRKKRRYGQEQRAGFPRGRIADHFQDPGQKQDARGYIGGRDGNRQRDGQKKKAVIQDGVQRLFLQQVFNKFDA